MTPSRCRGRKKPLSCRRSGNMDGIRVSEIEHAVENLDGDGDLGDLSLVGVEAQAIADDALPTPDLALHASSKIVAAVPLPSHAAPSLIAWMWRSRWVGAVSAVSLSAASRRGGTI